MCILPPGDKLFPHFRSLSSLPLTPTINYLRTSFLAVIYIHSSPWWGANGPVGLQTPHPYPSLYLPSPREAPPPAAWITWPSNQPRAFLLLVVPPSNPELAPSLVGIHTPA